jgi:hypothetical protein
MEDAIFAASDADLATPSFGTGNQLAFGRRQTGALIRLDRIENLADRIFRIRHWLPP